MDVGNGCAGICHLDVMEDSRVSDHVKSSSLQSTNSDISVDGQCGVSAEMEMLVVDVGGGCAGTSHLDVEEDSRVGSNVMLCQIETSGDAVCAGGAPSMDGAGTDHPQHCEVANVLDFTGHGDAPLPGSRVQGNRRPSGGARSSPRVLGWPGVAPLGGRVDPHVGGTPSPLDVHAGGQDVILALSAHGEPGGCGRYRSHSADCSLVRDVVPKTKVEGQRRASDCCGYDTCMGSSCSELTSSGCDSGDSDHRPAVTDTAEAEYRSAYNNVYPPDAHPRCPGDPTTDDGRLSAIEVVLGEHNASDQKSLSGYPPDEHPPRRRQSAGPLDPPSAMSRGPPEPELGINDMKDTVCVRPREFPCGRLRRSSADVARVDQHSVFPGPFMQRTSSCICVVVARPANKTGVASFAHFMQHAKTVGADAALVVTPYYNKPTQGGLIRHFTELHDQCDLPIVIYNIPGRSSIDMTPETMGLLAKLPRIIGVKDATGDLARVCSQRIACGPDFLQISGEDATAHGFNAQGGVGCISVTANVAPKLSAQLQTATLAGDYDKALELQDKLMPLHHAIFTEPGLVGVKYAMALSGLCSEEARLPLIPVTENTKMLIKSAIQSVGLA